MSLIDNINFLKNNFNNIYKKFKDYDESTNNEELELTETINGELSLLVKKDSDYISLHSRYNPTKEAQIILDEYKINMDKYKHVVFYGVGLGYIIDEFVNRYSDKDFSIYEPIDIIFNEYINRKRIQYKNLRYICVGVDEDEISKFIEDIFQHTQSGLLFLTLPSYKRIYNEKYNKFTYKLDLYVKDKITSLATNTSYQDLWIKNAIDNFEYTLNTPDIFIENKDRFKDKIGILVAAGPSLDFEIENLKYIKDNNMAFIFSISSATNALLKANIIPHAATSYDPQAGNMYGVFRKIIDDKKDNFPLIFGSTIYSDILKEYKGPLIHMVTSQDTISKYFLKNEDNLEIEIVNDASSIAVLTLELFYKLGCSKIILVGQNLSYYDGQNYASKMDEERDIEVDLNSSKIVKIKDVFGNLVPSNISYISAKNQMEAYIKLFKNVEIINTTKYGAAIEGTTYMDLAQVISKYLKKNDIDTDFYKLIYTNTNTKFLISRQEKMRNSRQDYDNLIEKIEKTLNKMVSLVRNNNFTQVDRMYGNLNTYFDSLEYNEFYKVFVLPMNRVYHKYLADKIKQVTLEKMTPFQKADIVINEYKRFIFVCKKEINGSIAELYNNLNDIIDQNTTQNYKVLETKFKI